MTTERIKEILEKHVKWWRGEDGGERAYLRSADLSGAYLRSADLSGADLRSADLDFSSGFTFQCTSFGAKIDLRLSAQMAYHFCRMECEDEEVKEAQKILTKLANKFHRVGECGLIGD